MCLVRHNLQAAVRNCLRSYQGEWLISLNGSLRDINLISSAVPLQLALEKLQDLKQVCDAHGRPLMRSELANLSLTMLRYLDCMLAGCF